MEKGQYQLLVGLIILILISVFIGTIYYYSNSKSKILTNQSNSSSTNQTTNTTIVISICSDGTEYGKCSSNKPKYCQNGTLIDKCNLCGCPSNNTCQKNESCIAQEQTNFIRIANGYAHKIYDDKIVFTSGVSFNKTSNLVFNDIYVYDLPTKNITKITDSTEQYIDPEIYGNKIVYGYYHMEQPKNGEMGVYLYNLDTSETKTIVDDNEYKNYRSIYGDIIAWVDKDETGNRVIYAYNLSNDQKIKITGDTISNPEFSEYVLLIDGISVYRDKIVWAQTDEIIYRNYTVSYTKSKIFLYDFSTGIKTQITENDSDCSYPEIYGNNIIYQENYFNSPGNYFYSYNLITGNKIRIEVNLWGGGYTAIYEDKIVWPECIEIKKPDNYCINHDIYMYDLSTGEKTAITRDNADQVYPDIYGNKIIWTENASIYMYEFPK
jgi:beta propeller repeat protein